MAKIFMIDETRNTSFINKIGFNTIPYNEISQDAEFHEYVIRIFENYDVEKLIIPVSLGNGGGLFRGLKLAMHIRLTKEIGLKKLIPIILISDLDFDEIMKRAKNDYLNLNYLLLTEGVALVENNPVLIKRVVDIVNPISLNKFQANVLGRLKIVPTELLGKHSLANQWGAFRLDEIAQTNALNNRKELKNRQKELYFKFIRALNDNLEELTNTTITAPKTIKNTGKRILLIDDEADKGWSDVLIKLFDKSDMQFIKKSTFSQFYNDAKARILNEDWDLILLDLRLNPEEEEQPVFIALGDINKYSGAQLLKEIKLKNKGTQVIIFTASNKAWNMKALLELGADGYFIKESPELGFTFQFSKENVENFIFNVESSLNKGYLQKIYTRKSTISTQLYNKKGTNTDYNDFLDELKNQLDISYELLYNANKKDTFAYSYVSLYQVLEMIADELVTRIAATTPVEWHIKATQRLKNYDWDEINNSLNGGINNCRGDKVSLFKKITGLYKQYIPSTSDSIIESLYWITYRRNKYIHVKSSFDTRQQLEVDKIFNEIGYTELLTIIEGILPVL